MDYELRSRVINCHSQGIRLHWLFKSNFPLRQGELIAGTQHHWRGKKKDICTLEVSHLILISINVMAVWVALSKINFNTSCSIPEIPSIYIASFVNHSSTIPQDRDASWKICAKLKGQGQTNSTLDPKQPSQEWQVFLLSQIAGWSFWRSLPYCWSHPPALYPLLLMKVPWSSAAETEHALTWAALCPHNIGFRPIVLQCKLLSGS